MNFQASPEAQAIRAENGYLVTNQKAIPLAPKDYPELAGVETAKDALPETYPAELPGLGQGLPRIQVVSNRAETEFEWKTASPVGRR